MKLGCVLRRAVDFSRARPGNVATLTALTMPIAIAFAAVTIDQASLNAQRRQAQSVTDLAALSAATNLASPEQAAASAFSDNGMPAAIVSPVQAVLDPVAPLSGPAIVVTSGRYTPQRQLAPAQRFDNSAPPHNAVRVNLRTPATRFFFPDLFPQAEIQTTAIASVTAEAAFSVGSRLASLNDGVVNAVLGALLGSSVSVQAMDYRGLLAADIDLLRFLDALATRANISAATYSDVLASSVTVGQMASAMAAVDGLDRAAKLSLEALARGAKGTIRVPLSHLVDLGSLGEVALGQNAPGLTATASVLDVLTAAAAIADGTRQVSVNLGVTLPGLAGARADIAIGEPPQGYTWFIVGEKGDVVRTAQTRVFLTVDVLGPGGTLGSLIRRPISVVVAFAVAKLASVRCPPGRPDSVGGVVAARPGVASLRIGEPSATALADFRYGPTFKPAKLVNLALVSIEGSAHVEVAQMGWQNLTFTAADISDRAVKSISTRTLTQSLTASLLQNLSLDVKVLGLGLGVGALTSTLSGTLGAVTPSVDALLASVLDALGVKVGEADIRVTGATCGRVVLVQ